MTDEKLQINKKILAYRVFIAVIGITILGIGIGFMRYAVFGVDPMTCLNIGIARQLGLLFGTWQLIVYSVLIVAMFFLDRSKIGFGTVYIIIAVGYTSDLFLWLVDNAQFLQEQFIQVYPLQTRIASLALGLLLCFFGASVYIETNMGLSPYDAAAIIIAEKMKKPDWFKWIRIGTDALCVTGGLLVKSDVGIGTLISVLLGGPLISFFRKSLQKTRIFRLIQNREL